MTASATTTTPRALPSQPTATVVPPDSCARATASESSGERCWDRSSSRRGRPTTTARPSTTPTTPRPSTLRELLDPAQLADPVPGAGRDRPGDGVLGGVLQGAGQPQDLVGVLAGAGDDIEQGHLPGGDRAGLVEQHGVDGAGALEHLGSLDQDAELGAPAGADHQGGRRGQSERAGAGDDQYGDGGRERRGEAPAGPDPEAEGGRRQRDHDRDEDSRDPVGQPLGLGLAVLGVLDQPGHLGELGVRADPGDLYDETPADVDGRADDGVPDADLHRHRLPGEHRGVDGGGTLLDHAVGGDLLPGAYDEPVADRQLLDRHPRLDRRPGAARRPSSPARAGPAGRHRPAASTGPRSSGRPG